MAQSYVQELLSRLTSETARIRQRYQELIRSGDAAYDAQLKELDRDYHSAARQASAEANISLKNNLEKMADAGYLGSGETVQATIAANNDRARTLQALAVQNAKDKSQILSQREADRNALALKEEEAVSALQKQADQAIREEEKAAREEERAKREWQAQEEQRAFDNSIKLQTLALQQQESQKKESEEKEAALTPEKDPYEYVDEIVKRNTTYDKKKGQKIIDRKAILKNLSLIIKDQNLSYRYRYEMFLYGKSLGYIKE